MAAASCALMVVGTLHGCGDDREKRCSRAVAHLVPIIAFDLSEIPEEVREKTKAINQQVEREALQACNREGLSEQQLACVLRVRTGEDFARIRTCPAIAERVPSWINVPAPEFLPQSIRLDAGSPESKDLLR